MDAGLVLSAVTSEIFVGRFHDLLHHPQQDPDQDHHVASDDVLEGSGDFRFMSI